MFSLLKQNRVRFFGARFVLPILTSAGLAAVVYCAPAIANAQQAVPAPTPPRFTVVLDAAHGGDDVGGHFSDVSEKDITLSLSVKLRSLLAARGMAVITTRESDTTVANDRRAELANHAKAQACLSLHATQSGTGIHLFTSSLPPTQPARISAWKTAQSASVTRSVALAGVVNSSLLQTGLPVTLGRTNLPTLDSMACPAVAIEIAPDRSQTDPTGPEDAAYQSRVATAIAAAILDWRSQVGQAEARQP